MPTTFQDAVLGRPYTVSPSVAAHGVEVSMADVKGIVFVVDDDISVREALTSLVRSTGWAAAPVFAGMLMQAGGLGLPLVFAGLTKIAYDLLLWREFRKVKPPEES